MPAAKLDGDTSPARRDPDSVAATPNEVFVPWSEGLSVDENVAAVSPALAPRDDTVRLPHFEPVPWDPDDALSPVHSRRRRHSPRRSWRGHAWWMGLLLVVVAVLAVPNLLRPRGRVESLRPGAQTSRTPSEGGASPQVAVDTPAPLAGDSNKSPVPPVGTGSVPLAATPASSTGRVAVTAPVPMEVFVGGRLAGSTQAGPITLPTGDHQVQFVSAETGYRATRRVTIRANTTSRVELRAPLGLLNVNVSPWADVYIGDQLIGQTPIGNIKVPIGRRVVTLRHPQLGERRVSVLVTLKRPARVAVDLNRS